MLILTASGCINSILNGPTPTPVATLSPSTTPSPTSTPLAEDNIVGLWEGSYKSIDYSIQFFKDRTLIYDEGGNQAKGSWERIDKNQYQIGILIYDTVITLNDNMTFMWGDKGIVFTKKT